MAKKDNDNFDFDTESEGKGKFDLVGFFKNLTKQQKGIILIAAVAVILVAAIVITFIALGTGNNNNNDIPNNNGGSGNTDPILPEDVMEFYISAAPSKSTYNINEEADYSGLVVYVRSETLGSVTIRYEDAPEKFTFTGFDSSKATDELIITVDYAGSTATFTVKVIPNSLTEASLVSITVDPLPKTTYRVGKSFNPTGGYIVAEYSDGTTETIPLTLENIVGFGNIAYTPGEHQIKVKYADDHGGYAETYITITITE